MSGAIPPLPQYSFMAWCLVKHRGKFTFTYGRTQYEGGQASYIPYVLKNKII